MPRGRGTRKSPSQWSSGTCQGSVSSAGSGRVAMIRKAIPAILPRRAESVAGVALVLLGGQPSRSGGDIALAVVGIAEQARSQTEATTADAPGELALEPVQVVDLPVDALGPVRRHPLPIGLGRRP